MKTTIKIIRNERNVPAGKLADAELHFSGGELDGLKLVGFGVWARRIQNPETERDDHSMHRINVTFPSRSFVVHGDRRNFPLVRAVENPGAQDRLRQLVLDAYLAEIGKTDHAST